MRSTLWIALALLLAFPHHDSVAARRTSLPGLAAFFDLDTGFVRDTNGDGLADAVSARIILPADPTLEEVQASANLAARLGFETTALDLPLVLRDNEVTAPSAIDVPVLVGSKNRFVQALAARGAIELPRLEAGQGVIARARSPLGGGDGVVVAGGDPAGTLAAANVLAARLPRLWSPTGATLRAVEEQAAQWLRRAGVAVGDVATTVLVVDRAQRGLASLVMRATVGAGDVERARRAIEDLDRAHRRGLEPRTLSYANAAATVVELWAGGRTAARATARRAVGARGGPQGVRLSERVLDRGAARRRLHRPDPRSHGDVARRRERPARAQAAAHVAGFSREVCNGLSQQIVACSFPSESQIPAASVGPR
ncbi:MAG TPA: hypothetical protein VNI83_10110 [Vicinamibacterales bacterium]|nr:hypothetical protein [Vicinamibacterales bacterium]